MQITPNQLCRKLSIDYPIIQAPMAGGLTSPELISAVSNEGCLGSMGAGYMTPRAIEKSISAIQQLTSKPYAVNLFIPKDTSATLTEIKAMQTIIAKAPFSATTETQKIQAPYIPSFDEQMDVVIAHRVPVFSFTFGLLAPHYIKKLKAQGTFIIGTATSISEAEALSKSKVDAICVQGFEAGGHRGSFIENGASNLVGNLALVPQVVDRVELPIIAAGGIMDRRGINAVLALGAEGAQMGTAFLMCKEAQINIAYQQALASQNEDNTVLTQCFSGKNARGIRNRFIDYMATYEKELLAYPIQHVLTRAMRTKAKAENNDQFLSLWAGQGAPLGLKVPISVKAFLASILF